MRSKRLRNALALVIGTAMLVFALPGMASAASGGFSYHFVDADGIAQESVLLDPPSRECITLPEVADADTTLPADSPRNRTDATAIVFTEPGCAGDYFSLRPLTGYGSERLKLRSVLFS
ncbi:hypothetical protein KDL01_40750 [Actinospica durhamensis]|uniref:Uncharacterized protein n=1 Tax=Actinospica durhamensis TaxID=1508375 RepID=A0A941IUU8_9ACTN|nr:hypothetical protein [Actinospica durhamensis]MBR7839652.1 hypothetical protein [Actinospica durhamensis]